MHEVMKRKSAYYQIVLAICLFLSAGNAGAQDSNPCKTGGQTFYFGVEINNILCGYSVETENQGEEKCRSKVYNIQKQRLYK